MSPNYPLYTVGNRAPCTRDSVFRDFYAFFGIFIYTLFFYSPALCVHIVLYYINCILFSVAFSCFGRVCRYAIKPTGPIKTQLNFFSFPIFPLFRVYLRSVICDRFLLIFRIRKPFSYTCINVGCGGACVKRKRDYRVPNRLIYCTVYRELLCNGS